ncbi:MAG: PKD domain-containing protein, partial [Atribacterota bacterium]
LIQEPDGNPLTGENGTIALIRLLVMKDISAGRESPLNLDNIELTSAKGMSLPVNRVNGAFNVVGIEPTSIPSPTPASSPTPVPTKTPVPTSQNGGQGEGEVISLQVTPSFIEKGRVGEKYSFQVTLPATAQGWRVKLLWIFGDGTKVLSTEDTSVDHVYSKKGQFVLSVKAFNKANGKMIGMQKVKISIDEPKPPLSDNQTVEIEIIPGIRNQQHELQIFREKYSNGKLKVEYSFYTSPDGSEIRQGMETSWYPSGKKKSQGEYLNGQKEGVWISWYENGSQGQKGSYRQNGKEGIWTKYYQNGKIESQGPYKDNRREGKWTKWYEDGRKFAEFKCQNDQIVSGSYKEYR